MLVFTPTFTYFGQLINGSGSESSLSAVEQLGGGELEAAGGLVDQAAGRHQITGTNGILGNSNFPPNSLRLNLSISTPATW